MTSPSSPALTHRARRQPETAAPPDRRTNRQSAALVEGHLGLVRAMACKMIRCGSARHVELDELLSIGTQALIESARRFDPSTGAQFSTFVFPRIRGAMIDGIAQLSPVPRGAYRGARRRAAAGEPGLFVSSLEVLCASGGEPAAELDDPADKLDLARLSTFVAAALARLPERKRRFIEGHYFGGRDLKTIGRELGLSKSWASRLHGQALADLRLALAVAA